MRMVEMSNVKNFHFDFSDIKSANILITRNGVLKLADFGISKAMEHTQEKAMSLVGTPYYLW